jgi:hypothetical protein
MWFPVYKQNLKAMQQIISAMNDPSVHSDVHKVRALFVKDGNHGLITKITIKDAVSRASMLKPGDNVAITLLDGDLVMQCRFPSVREESWSSFQVKKDDNTIITIPLSVCEMKMADFDGDEANICIPFAHYTDMEALLLHSPIAQYIAYKDGNPAIWFPWTGDAAYGLEKFTQGRKCIIFNGKNVDEYDVISKVETFLPQTLSYEDSKLCIKKGKLPDKRTAFRNADFFKYYATLYGYDKATDLMDNLTQLAYDVNIDQGCSLGYEIKIYGKDTKEKINKIKAVTEQKLFTTEVGNDKYKDAIQLMNVDSQKAEIKKLLIEGAVGTNIEAMGYTKLRQEEYYQTVVALDPVTIDGTRIQPILAEGSRTCAAFPRYSIDPRAYGYIPTGYNGDISPVAHSFGNKQQRFALYQKGQGTAKQGYAGKKFAAAFGYTFVDFNGAVVSNNKLVSYVYGAAGLDPRNFVKQPLHEISTPEPEFVKKYGDNKRLVELFKSINRGRKKYAEFTKFTRANIMEEKFVAGFDYEQYINIHKEEKEGSTPAKLVDEFITDIKTIFCPPNSKDTRILMNLEPLEYYFRIKLSKVNLSKYHLDVIIVIFTWTLAGGGDPVGMKAALACSEPLTQASLHAIHHVGGGATSGEVIRRSAGLTRFQELVTGNSRKDTVITITLYDDSKESCAAFANEQETFYYNSIWSRSEVRVSRKIDERLLEMHKELDLGGIEISPFHVVAIWNLAQISAYHIHVCDIINNLVKNYEDIMFISGYVLNASEFQAFIYFKPNVKIDRINNISEEWALESSSNIVHGKYLKNCFVSENKNKPGHWIIEANEISPKSLALQNLIFDPRIDPYGCRTTDSEVNQKMFGTFEATARQYEELIYTAANLSDTSGVLQRHYKIIADMIFMNDTPQFADRSKLKHDPDMDNLRLTLFETAKDMVIECLKYGKEQPIDDPVAAAVFGTLPCIGTGVSKVTLVAK